MLEIKKYKDNESSEEKAGKVTLGDLLKGKINVFKGKG